MFNDYYYYYIIIIILLSLFYYKNSKLWKLTLLSWIIVKKMVLFINLVH